MGYRVTYQPIKKIRGTEKRRARRAALTALCFLLFLVLVNFFWPQGKEVLQDLLIPDDLSITAAAMEELSSDLKAGEGLRDSMAAFCRKIYGEMEFDIS